MPPRAAPPKRSTRRIIEDEESDEPEDQYDDDEEEQAEEAYDEDEEVDELDDEEEEYAYGGHATSGPKTGLKIKLNVGGNKGKGGGTVVSTPGETPPFILPRPKRASKRRVVDDEQEDQEEEDEDEDSAAVTPAAASSQPARLTARQAAQAGVGGPIEHVSLEEPPNPRKRKWTEEELALRREEAARKRKLKGAQRQEDEKQMIINRLINKGTGVKRGRWPAKTKEPTPEADEEGEDGAAATGAAGEGTEAGEANESSSSAEEEQPGTSTPAPVRGGWRGRGRRGRGARLPPPPVKMHIPVMRWISGMRDIVLEDRDEPIQVDPTDFEKDKNPTATDQASSTQPKPNVEKEPFISLSIPNELISATLIEEPIPPPAPKKIPQCAVSGCSLQRKYKLVGSPDPEIGACGMEHLTKLQKSSAVH
ncbi:hypothetical protein CPB86DRAFT_28437 [Serendipita vermifera]|nr:hypothetical protein CPB86DRAFT_28437 [Serendipita vermifera]